VHLRRGNECVSCAKVRERKREVVKNNILNVNTK
jgi:hypothetical protein